MICVPSPVSQFEDNARKISCPYIYDSFRLAAAGQTHRALHGLELLSPTDTFQLIHAYELASQNFLTVAEDPSESIAVRVAAIASVGSGIIHIHDAITRLRGIPAHSLQDNVRLAVPSVALLMTVKGEIKFKDKVDRLLKIVSDPSEDVEICSMALGVCASIDELSEEIPGSFDHDRYHRDLEALSVLRPTPALGH